MNPYRDQQPVNSAFVERPYRVCGCPLCCLRRMMSGGFQRPAPWQAHYPKNLCPPGQHPPVGKPMPSQDWQPWSFGAPPAAAAPKAPSGQMSSSRWWPWPMLWPGQTGHNAGEPNQQMPTAAQSSSQDDLTMDWGTQPDGNGEWTRPMMPWQMPEYGEPGGQNDQQWEPDGLQTQGASAADSAQRWEQPTDQWQQQWYDPNTSQEWEQPMDSWQPQWYDTNASQEWGQPVDETELSDDA